MGYAFVPLISRRVSNSSSSSSLKESSVDLGSGLMLLPTVLGRDGRELATLRLPNVLPWTESFLGSSSKPLYNRQNFFYLFCSRLFCLRESSQIFISKAYLYKGYQFTVGIHVNVKKPLQHT